MACLWACVCVCVCVCVFERQRDRQRDRDNECSLNKEVATSLLSSKEAWAITLDHCWVVVSRGGEMTSLCP